MMLGEEGLVRIVRRLKVGRKEGWNAGMIRCI